MKLFSFIPLIYFILKLANHSHPPPAPSAYVPKPPTASTERLRAQGVRVQTPVRVAHAVGRVDSEEVRPRNSHGSGGSIVRRYWWSVQHGLHVGSRDAARLGSPVTSVPVHGPSAAAGWWVLSFDLIFSSFNYWWIILYFTHYNHML